MRQAVELTERYPNGRQRLASVKMVLWAGRYTLEREALQIPCSWRTAAQWNGDFIKLVAKNCGLFD